MPISRDKNKLYPGGSIRSPQWRAIRESILARENHQCKFCQLDHQQWVEWTPGKRVQVILTIAHLDHDPTHNDPSNLAALCQRCHNRYDMKHRRANAEKTKQKNKETA